MEALLLDLRASVPAAVEPAVPDAADHEGYLHQHTLSAEDLQDHLRLFERHCERLDQPLTQEQEERNFSCFFGLVREALLNAGTFSERSLDEADFTARSDAEPAHVLRVKSWVDVTPEIAIGTLSACLSMGSDYAVIFDGREGRSVLFSNGDFVQEADG